MLRVEDRDENRSAAQNQVNNNNINNSIEARNLSGHRHCSLLASFVCMCVCWFYSFFIMDSSFAAHSSSREVVVSSSSSCSIASSNLRYIEKWTMAYDSWVWNVKIAADHISVSSEVFCLYLIKPFHAIDVVYFFYWKTVTVWESFAEVGQKWKIIWCVWKKSWCILAI